MSGIELVRVDRADVPEFLGTMRRFFGQPVEAGHRHVAAALSRSTLARLDGEDVGTSGVIDLELALPGGGVVAMDGVTVVVVSPVARRRGVLRAMMARLLDDARDRRAPLLGLFATESSIYRRFGYGVASHAALLEVETVHASFRTPPEDSGRLRSIPLTDALPAWRAVWGQPGWQPGWIPRPDALWERVMATAARDDHKGALQVVVHEDGSGVVDGFVNYRQEIRWREDVADGLVRVEHMGSCNPMAHLALWRHLLELDLCEHLEMERFWVDDPLQHLLSDPRRLRVLPRDDLHLRVVDVVAVLAARRYARDDSVVIEVRDPAAGDIAGRYRVEGGLAGAVAARTSEDADIVLDAPSLGALVLGDVSVPALHAAGLVEEATSGAVRRAGAMFAWQPRPCVPYLF